MQKQKKKIYNSIWVVYPVKKQNASLGVHTLLVIHC